MKATREAAYNYILKDEVHFISSELNPGETTHQGFNLSQLKTLTGKPWLSDNNLKSLDVDTAKALFDEHYWDPLKCDHLPVGLDYFLFDSAVVHGRLIASRWLQFALRVPPTGTLSWANCKEIDDRDSKEIIATIESYRRKFIRNHVLWSTHGSLWSNRVTRVRTRSLKLAGVK